MIGTLISSKTRIKLLLKFFLNSNTTSYLRGLEAEFGDSTNSIRLELNRFEKAGMLSSFTQGNKKLFQANTKHPLYHEVHNIVMKYIGFDKIIENVIENLGEIEHVFVTGRFAQGLNSDIIDLVFVGNVDQMYLIKLIDKAEDLVSRKIRYVIYKQEEKDMFLGKDHIAEPLLLWSNKIEV